MDTQLFRSSSQDTLTEIPSALNGGKKASIVSIDSFPSSASIVSCSSSSSSPITSTSYRFPPRSGSRTEHYLDWTLKFLGVVSAVLFGIWAPVSYQAQTSGNKSSDEVQSKLVERVESLGEDMEALRSVVEGLGKLRAWEICEGRQALEACKALSSQLPLNSLLNDLISPHPSHNPSFRRSLTSPSPTPLPSSVSYPAGGLPSKVLPTPITTIPFQDSQSPNATPSHPHTRGLITPAPTSSAIFPGPGLGIVPGMDMEISATMPLFIGLGFVVFVALTVMAIAGSNKVKRRIMREKGAWGRGRRGEVIL
ncbi:hypothetical protein P154DRAFT_561011 [Amniculicola lignicola CBS 123094]|uniref:Transmembrane protein n=1 Tax=Amniculicola lignicola CBS 123094 TaxID=1392246 RepID=A0A6A5WXP3_9PLEO|nr:hypothetical protein P154DRAFT_561011 [Amniculicola lignicola CBS 123094]